MSWIRKLLPFLFLLIVTLSWDASPTQGIDGYKVYAGKLGGPYELQQTLGNVLTATLDLNGRKCFAVTAYQGENESTLSNIVCEEIEWSVR